MVANVAMKHIALLPPFDLHEFERRAAQEILRRGSNPNRIARWWIQPRRFRRGPTCPRRLASRCLDKVRSDPQVACLLYTLGPHWFSFRVEDFGGHRFRAFDDRCYLGIPGAKVISERGEDRGKRKPLASICEGTIGVPRYSV